MTLTSRGQQEGNYLNKTKHLLLIVNIQARNTYALCMIVGWKSWIVHLSILVPPSLPHIQLYCIIGGREWLWGSRGLMDSESDL